MVWLYGPASRAQSAAVCKAVAREGLAAPKVREVLRGAYFNMRSIGAAGGDRIVCDEARPCGRFIRESNIEAG